MIVLVGTVPYKTGVFVGEPKLDGHWLALGEDRFSVERGTAAMAASCLQVCLKLNLPKPLCVFGGDIVDGRGTELMFKDLNARLASLDADTIVLHYMFPKLVYAEPFIKAIHSLAKRPKLIADAGGMYLMKTANLAKEFDVFTPDEGEMVFLADETAPHPLYVRRELLDKGLSLDELVERAYQNSHTARITVLKGARDQVYQEGKKVFELSSPLIPAMEAIGGTGDTITGMLAALMAAGDKRAVEKSLILNRQLGQLTHCSPATQISDFIAAIPQALDGLRL